MMGNTAPLSNLNATSEILEALDELGHSLARALQTAWQIDSGECSVTSEMFAAYDARVSELRQMKQFIGSV
jgi:hypothetical protein